MSPNKTPKIAVVSPTPAIVETLGKVLPDMSPKTFPTARSFISSAMSGRFDLAIIDMDIPDISGRDLLVILRTNKKTRRMILAAVSGILRTTHEVASTLDGGADEYFILPGQTSLIRPRILNLIQRQPYKVGASLPNEYLAKPLTLGRLKIDTMSRVVSLNEKELPLTALEFDMLMYFRANSDRIITRQTLLQQVWKRDLVVNPRSVDTRIEFLRKKIRGAKVTISTVFGIGYILKR